MKENRPFATEAMNYDLSLPSVVDSYEDDVGNVGIVYAFGGIDRLSPAETDGSYRDTLMAILPTLQNRKDVKVNLSKSWAGHFSVDPPVIFYELTKVAGFRHPT